MLTLFNMPTKTEAQAEFEQLCRDYNVTLPQADKKEILFSHFETKDPNHEKILKNMRKYFNDRKYIKAGIYQFMRTRKYYSMWDLHYDEVTTLFLNDYTVVLTRKYTYANTHGHKFHDYDFIEIKEI